MVHELKIKPEYFEKVISGEKTFEIRKNDRNFAVGDVLALNEWDKEYTGRSCLVYIDYILSAEEFMLPHIVAMAIKPVYTFKSGSPINASSLKHDYSVPLVSEEKAKW